MYLKFWLFITFGGILVCICFLSGCGSLLLSKAQLNELAFPDTDEHMVVYHSQHYLNSASGKLYSTTRRLIQIGKNTKTAPDYFAIVDGSAQRLDDFEARLLKKNGSEITFSIGDLNTIKTSSSYIISDIDIKYLPITEVIESGDLLEMVSVHEYLFPATGIHFSPADVGSHGVNIECSFEIQKNDTLFFNVINDKMFPEITETDNSKIYKFKWKKYSKSTKKSIFKNKNSEPIIFATVPRYYDQKASSRNSIKTWRDFGNWYYELIKSKLQSNTKIALLARKLTKGKKTSKEKMDAIFHYCQKNIRYEQVYLEFGELIPNKCEVIFKRKYGDCKDYSTLIYTMAKSVGLNPSFALCYRGRGKRFYKDLPVSQFNHVIIHFEDNGQIYWYDGTNRTGIPGITSSDLINQPALIIEKNKSRFVTIKEHKSNLLLISGNLKKEKTGLTGKIDISLNYQYSIIFFYLDFFYNNVNMQNFLIDWVKNNLNNNIMLKKLSWQKNSQDFNIYIDCEIPNSIVELNNKSYLSFNRCFPELFIQEDLPKESDDLFYFHGYNRVSLNLNFENLKSLQNEKEIMELEYNLLPGPFSKEDKIMFKKDFTEISKCFKKKYTFREEP